jgi:hypothetical protein
MSKKLPYPRLPVKPPTVGPKVQIGLRPVQRSKRERHLQVPGLGPQVSGTGFQVQVQVPGEIQILNPNPNLNLAPVC